MAAPGPVSVNAASVLDLLKTLVAIPSVNPSLGSGGAGEGEIARCLAGACARLGLVVALEEVAPGRPNVTAVLPGADPSRGRSLLLNGHTDTVGAGAMEAPFSPRLEGDRLYGRGVFDMKCGLAAMVEAVAALLRAGIRPRGDVILTFAADEEHASLGTAAIARTRRADAAIVTEPTQLRICIAHKGFAWVMMRTAGRAAHGSDHAAGIDAIAHMGRILSALERFDRDVLAERSHPLLGRPSLHASLISGGEGPSTYPPSCELGVERRTLPGETAESVRAEFEAILDRLRRDDPLFQATTEIVIARPGLEVDRGAPIVRALHAAVERHVTRPPEYVGQAAWFDAALLAEAGIPAVIFGPSGAGWHAAVEYVDLPSVTACAQVLAQVIIDFCGTAPS